MYIIDLVKLRDIFANRSMDYRDGGDGKTAEIFNHIEAAFTSSALRESLESVIDDRAKEIVIQALAGIMAYTMKHGANEIHITRYAVQDALDTLCTSESGQCTTPNDGPLASPVTSSNDADPDAMRIVRLERIANSIIDYSEASCIDESDPDDPMAKIIRETRDLMRRPAPSPRPIDCAECKIQPSFVPADIDGAGEKLHCNGCGKETWASKQRSNIVRHWREMNEAGAADSKAETVTLNQCRVCGSQAKRRDNGDLFCPNNACAFNWGHSSKENWNLANPLPSPVTPERRFKPGQRFCNSRGREFILYWNGKICYPEFVRADFTDTRSVPNKDIPYDDREEGWTAEQLGVANWTPVGTASFTVP